MRTVKEQREAISSFLKELQELSDKYKVYIDGFYLTETCRDVVIQDRSHMPKWDNSDVP